MWTLAPIAWPLCTMQRRCLPLLAEPALQDLPSMVLGAGSNVLFATDRFDGLPDSPAVRFGPHRGATTATHALVHVDAGFEWDALVDWTLDHGLQGLENLALIPGPGGRRADPEHRRLRRRGRRVHRRPCTSTTAQAGAFDRLTTERCGFGYRDSVFKREPDRRIVTRHRAAAAERRRDQPRAMPDCARNSPRWAA